MFHLLGGLSGCCYSWCCCPSPGWWRCCRATLPPRPPKRRCPACRAQSKSPSTPTACPSSVPPRPVRRGRDAGLSARARPDAQMDPMRRTASGRVGDRGPAALSVDEMIARARAAPPYRGQSGGARQPETRALKDTYAHRMNAWIGAARPVRRPRVRPLRRATLWTPANSLLWASRSRSGSPRTGARSWRGWSLAGHLDPARIDELSPPDSEAGRPDAALAPTPRAAYADAARAVLTVIPHFPAPMTEPGEASDERAVDGRHTGSGPLLAGDPHLAFGFPGLWYL